MAAFSLVAPAKINLTLEVLRKREDGFHELRTLMAGVGVYDGLSFKAAQVLELKCSEPALDCGASNLVIKAAELLRAKYPSAARLGASIYLKKNIPLAGGLAGGSSDAAAALKGLNKLWKLKLNHEGLGRLAAELGSDVPYCLANGLALGSGRGEKLRQVRLSLPKLWVMLVNPGFAVPTKWVYESLNLKGSRKGNTNYTALALKALKTKNWGLLENACVNDLETVTAARYSVINIIKNKLKTAGALVSRMSGSGPTVWGLFDSPSKASKAVKELQNKYPFCKYAPLLHLPLS